MQRFCLAIAVSGLLVLLTAATLLVARPELLHAQAAFDPFSNQRAALDRPCPIRILHRTPAADTGC
jgi:hypothetical protein